MSSTVTINKGSYTVPGPGRDEDWAAYTTNLLSALSSNAGRDLSKAIFFDKNGSDAADGLTPAKSVLTIGQAIELANALSPSASNPISIIGLDAGIYTEAVSLPTYISLIAPAVSLVGQLTIRGGGSTVLRSHINPSGTCVNVSTGQTVYYRADILGDGTGTAIDTNDGVFNGWVGVINATTKYDLAASGTVNIFCHSITGAAAGSGTANVIAADTVFSGLGFLKADGTVAMSGNLNMGSNDIDSVADVACNTITINGVQFSADANGLYQV